MKILVWAHLDDAGKQLLQDNLGDHDVTLAGRENPELAQKSLAETEIVFGNIPPQWLDFVQPNLRWMQLESVGFGIYHGKPGIAPITITNLRGFFAEPVAETALAGILALYRKLDVLIAAQSSDDRNWKMLELRTGMRLLEGAKVIILGGGSIGLRMKKLLTGFDCEVTVYSKTTPEADIYTLEELDTKLPGTDIVVGCLPHSQETVGLFTAERIALLGSDGMFVNVGRGSAVDEPALIEALQSGRLGGAVLDVTYEEPLPKDHPLWNCPNTIITQHTGGGFREELYGKAQLFLRNLEHYQTGEPLENIVNFERGY